MELTGKRLAQCRREANFTQEEFADLIGISFQAVSYWERGKTMPDFSNLILISQLYNVSIDYLLGNEKQSRAVRSVMEKKQPPTFLR